MVVCTGGNKRDKIVLNRDDFFVFRKEEKNQMTKG